MRSRRFVLTVVTAIVGGAAVVALGLSLLAAHQTVENALADGRPLVTLGAAELKADLKAMNGRPQAAIHIRCLGQVAPATSSGSVELVSVSNAKTEREAACLHRRGFLSARGLTTVDKALGAKPRSPVSSLFPLRAQVVPSDFTVGVWVVVALAELAILGRVAVLARRRPTATRTG